MADNRTRIQRLKSRLASGNLSQAEAENVAAQIRSLGGKVAISNYGYTGKQGTVTTTPTAPAATSTTSTTDNREQIQRLKNRLASGNLSQAEAESVASRIRSLGGKVAITNFGYTGGGGGQAVTGAPASDGRLFDPIKNAHSAVDANVNLADLEAEKQAQFANPSFSTPFGGQEVTFDENGMPTGVTQYLSPEQQSILDQGQMLTQHGQRAATDLLSGYQPFTGGPSREGYSPFQGPSFEGYSPFSIGNLSDERERIEDQIFGRLTRNLERDRARDIDQAEQTMYNRGIPLDPSNPRYQREMEAINERYDSISADAAARATEMGGQELQRTYGMGLGTHQQGMADIGQMYGQHLGQHQQQMADFGQFYGQDMGTHQQYLSDLAALQGQGTGLLLPQLPGYAAPGYDLGPAPSDVYAGMQALKQNAKQLALQRRLALGGGGGGGGGGGVAAPPPPESPPIANLG